MRDFFHPAFQSHPYRASSSSTWLVFLLFNFCKPSFRYTKSASICSDCTLCLIKAHSSLSSSIIKFYSWHNSLPCLSDHQSAFLQFWESAKYQYLYCSRNTFTSTIIIYSTVSRPTSRRVSFNVIYSISHLHRIYYSSLARIIQPILSVRKWMLIKATRKSCGFSLQMFKFIADSGDTLNIV